MTDNTPDTQLEEITETGTPNIPDHTATPYTPVFNDTVRTVIYVVTLVASVMRTGLYATPNPAAMMPAAVLMKPPISGEPKLMNPSPMTEATSVTT